MANSTFTRGQLILSSTPVLVLDEATFDDLPSSDRLGLQAKAVQSLPEKSRELFWELSGAFGGDGVEDRLRTNTFAATFGGGDGRWGVVVPEAAVSFLSSCFLSNRVFWGGMLADIDVEAGC